MTLEEILEATRRSLAEEFARPWLAVPADLFLFGTTTADLLDSAGELVDKAKVVAAAEALGEERPRLRTLPTPSGIRWTP